MSENKRDKRVKQARRDRIATRKMEALIATAKNEEQLEILQQTLLHILGDYPGPDLSQENSMSYPRWIARASGG